MRQLFIFCAVLMVFSCQTEKGFTTDPNDYNSYLASNAPKTTSKYFELWNAKIKPDSIQLLSLGNVASEYNRYFKNTGNIQFLKKAEKALAKAVDIAAINKSGYLRALARNYISQHRFKEALELARSAKDLGSGVTESNSLLFDIHMELGNYKTAHKYLDTIRDMTDFGYLIRVAKWNDHKGDLETTIAFMEKAVQKAESAKNKPLMVWSYANIADYYGHAGNIEDSYKHYLKTLALEPSNAYAKKWLAWIVFSYEKDPREALRILDSINTYYNAPDYFLLKAEIAQFMGNEKLAAKNRDDYHKLVQKGAYGTMYNVHNVDFQIAQVKNYGRALQIAEEETANRATPETYSLLAYAHFKKGNQQKALEIVEDRVMGKTFEPAILMRILEIYEAYGMMEEVSNLKKELKEAQYELGPLSHDKIASF